MLYGWWFLLLKVQSQGSRCFSHFHTPCLLGEFDPVAIFREKSCCGFGHGHRKFLELASGNAMWNQLQMSFKWEQHLYLDYSADVFFFPLYQPEIPSRRDPWDLAIPLAVCPNIQWLEPINAPNLPWFYSWICNATRWFPGFSIWIFRCQQMLVGGLEHEWIMFHFIKKGCHPSHWL